MGGVIEETNRRTDHHHFLTRTDIFPENQEVHALGDFAEHAVADTFCLNMNKGTNKRLSPFSCSAASLKSGNLDPTMLWLRISLCS